VDCSAEERTITSSGDQPIAFDWPRIRTSEAAGDP
jgi:hypothetical protein